MATELFMPTLGMNQETGKIIEWLAAEGQSVTQGQPVMVVETDKATVELEAPASGKLVNVRARAGEEVPVGQVVAWIVGAGETVPAGDAPPTPTPALPSTPPQAAPAVAAPPAPTPGLYHPASPLAVRIAGENGVDLSQVPCAGDRIQKEDVLAYLRRQAQSHLPAVQPGGKILASPKARRLAREYRLNLGALAGSGPHGAVLAKDVAAAGAAASASAAVASAADPLATMQPGRPEGGEAPGLPTSKMWQVMAQRLTTSWQTVPHFYLEAEANATQLKAWRARLLERLDEKVTFTDLIVKLTALALRRCPRLNAGWVDRRVQPNPQVNIGLAVAVEDGLLVPVIRDADRLGIRELAACRQALVAGAQANRLALDEMRGGTFTISNLGMYDRIEAFSAIVNPPEAAILALGRIAERVVAVNGQAVVQPMLRMTLSCDHRVVDGARGAEFLQTLAGLIEDPLTALD